jgi:hypothetical protein
MSDKLKFIAQGKIQRKQIPNEPKRELSQLLRDFYIDGTGRSCYSFSRKAILSTDYVEFLEELVDELIKTDSKRDADILRDTIKKHEQV